jgi:hypothetical protein
MITLTHEEVPSLPGAISLLKSLVLVYEYAGIAQKFEHCPNPKYKGCSNYDEPMVCQVRVTMGQQWN